MALQFIQEEKREWIGSGNYVFRHYEKGIDQTTIPSGNVYTATTTA